MSAAAAEREPGSACAIARCRSAARSRRASRGAPTARRVVVSREPLAPYPDAPDRSPARVGRARRPSARSSPSASTAATGAASATARRCDARARSRRRCSIAALGRAAGRDPLRQRHRAPPARARRDARRRAVRAGLAGVFARLAGLRQAAPHPRHADAGPRVRERAGVRQGDRRGRARARRRSCSRKARSTAARRCRSPSCSRTAPTAAVDAAHAQRRPRHDRQVPVHLGLDQAAEGRDQHAAHAVREPADDPPVLPGAGRGAAGAGRLAAVEPHLRRQPQRRHRRSTTAARSTSTKASRRRR